MIVRLLFPQDTTFLEACIENHTKSNLYMDQVEFEPAQNWTATLLKAADNSSEHNLLPRWVSHVCYSAFTEKLYTYIFWFEHVLYLFNVVLAIFFRYPLGSLLF